MKKHFIIMAVFAALFCVQALSAATPVPYCSIQVDAQARFLGYIFDSEGEGVNRVFTEIVNLSDEVDTTNEYPYQTPTEEQVAEMVRYLTKNAKQVVLYNFCSFEKQDILAYYAKHVSEPVKATIVIKVFKNLKDNTIRCLLVDHDLRMPGGTAFETRSFQTAEEETGRPGSVANKSR